MQMAKHLMGKHSWRMWQSWLMSCSLQATAWPLPTSTLRYSMYTLVGPDLVASDQHCRNHCLVCCTPLIGFLLGCWPHSITRSLRCSTLRSAQQLRQCHVQKSLSSMPTPCMCCEACFLLTLAVQHMVKANSKSKQKAGLTAHAGCLHVH